MTAVDRRQIVTRSKRPTLARAAGHAAVSLEMRGVVTAGVHAGHVTASVEGPLDRDAGEALIGAVTRAVEVGVTRVDVDLVGVTSFSREGACALARCREVCGAVGDGLHFRTESGAGQQAVLAAFEREAVVE